MKLFKKDSEHEPAGASSADEAQRQVDSPYLAAQHVWIERYGSYVSAASNWRLLAILEAVALIVCIAGLIHLAGQNRFIPYIVAVDKIGMAIAVHPAEQASPVDSRVVRAELANWIVQARSVVTDRVVERYYLDNVFAFVPPGSAARGFLEQYYPANSPYQRAASKTVSVAIGDMVSVSPSTYEVQWVETSRDLQGNVTGTEQWDGTFGVGVNPPSDEASIIKNPAGVTISSVSWIKKF